MSTKAKQGLKFKKSRGPFHITHNLMEHNPTSHNILIKAQVKITVTLQLSVTKLGQKSFWESYSSAERITAFLHRIIIDWGGGGGGGFGGRDIARVVYLKDDAYPEKFVVSIKIRDS